MVWSPRICSWTTGRCHEEAGSWAVWISTRPFASAGYNYESQHTDVSWCACMSLSFCFCPSASNVGYISMHFYHMRIFYIFCTYLYWGVSINGCDRTENVTTFYWLTWKWSKPIFCWAFPKEQLSLMLYGEIAESFYYVWFAR